MKWIRSYVANKNLRPDLKVLTQFSKCTYFSQHHDSHLLQYKDPTTIDFENVMKKRKLKSFVISWQFIVELNRDLCAWKHEKLCLNYETDWG